MPPSSVRPVGAFVIKLPALPHASLCILYDREKLLAVGGSTFWSRLPRFHSGEEVLVQNLLMRRWGGCGILPTGTYCTQPPTSVLNERSTVDGHALDFAAYPWYLSCQQYC